MRVLTKEEFQVNLNRGIISLHNMVFIHPTDTIYGMGCNAEDDGCVKKIRSLKERDTAPFSIIAPSIEWVKENCFIDEKAERWLKKLPGPITLVLKLKNIDAISKYVNPGMTTIGVRIPKNWFQEIVAEKGVPIITTSANKHNGNFMTSLDNLDNEIRTNVDFIIYEDEKISKPSKIVDLTEPKFKILRR